MDEQSVFESFSFPILMFCQILKYENELVELIQLLHDKALSKRGYSWTGKLLSSLLLTLTHTYPLENKFVDPDQWKSEGNHYHSCQTILIFS